MKIIVTEQISEKGIARLREEAEVDVRYSIDRGELLDRIGDYDAIIVRSATVIDEELLNRAKKLKAVGRAGNGIDNIDIKSAIRHGVIVTNTPEGNIVSAAEHTIGMLLSLCRNIPLATAFLKAGNWGRKQFQGVELYNKTAGIIGLGRIGSLVATRLQSFGMKVIAYDPYISEERFHRLGVERVEALDDLLARSDFVTVHTPKTEETSGMIGKRELKLMKPWARIVNCARGGIIRERDLYDALKEGALAGAALDVFEDEPSYNNPLFSLPNVVVTAHMGASTREAQDNIGITIAQQVLSALKGEIVSNAVNLPSLPTQELIALKPYIGLAEKIGKLYFQLEHSPVNRIEITYSGELAGRETGMVTVAFLKGLLETVLKERVNYVNAPYLAETRGIKVVESKEGHGENYSSLMRFRVTGEKVDTTFAGTVFGRDEEKIVEAYGYKVDVVPTRYMLFVENFDIPGMIGTVGTVLGGNGINIATMQVGRKHVGSKALMILNVDNPAGREDLEKIQQVNGIISARFVRL